MLLGSLSWSLLPLTLVLLSISCTSHASPIDETDHFARGLDGRRTSGGVHVPLLRRTVPKLRKRGDETSTMGLGDYVDVTYNVLVQVGSTEMPVVVDTGSSDLWVITDDCVAECNTSASGVQLYPHSSFQPSGLDARLLYGDSRTGTHAYGQIGKDAVGLAGLLLQDQYFAAINDTNTSVLETGSAGIFGLGFPINSVLWNEIFDSEHPGSTFNGKRGITVPSHLYDTRSRYSSKNLATRYFPALRFLHAGNTSHTTPLAPRQSPSPSTSSVTPTALSSYSSIGPLIARFVAAGSLAQPMFSITLQRDAIDIGGNLGMLSIGELPKGVINDSLTWVGIKRYTPAEGGLPPPPDSPTEAYPISWEIPIDDVYVDGQKLDRSTLSSSSISLTALLDTGNSLIRGPSDVVRAIFSTVSPGSSTTSASSAHFPCSANHTLAFLIGGRLFPVDPRDFVSQAFTDSVDTCVANLAATDPPQEGRGYQYSWSLGDPFLKSVLASFYYGNLSYPSRDPPRVGLLSTVPPDAGDHLRAAITLATGANRNFPVTSDSAPSGTLTPAGTGAGGVPLARTTTSIPSGLSPPKSSNGASSIYTFNQWNVVALTAVAVIFASIVNGGLL